MKKIHAKENWQWKNVGMLLTLWVQTMEWSMKYDGLSKEFYICFFKEIDIYPIQALNHSFSNEQMSNSQRQAVVPLIEKKREKIKGTFKNGDQSLSLTLMPK